MQKYHWKVPHRFKVDADTAAEELNKCADEQGYIQPRTVVAASRPQHAPLHGEFEWQNDIAADKWREQQARTIINNIVTVTVSEDSRQDRQVKTFVHVISESSNGYKLLNVAIQNSSEREYILGKALQELNSFRAKYHNLTEMTKVVEVINETLER